MKLTQGRTSLNIDSFKSHFDAKKQALTFQDPGSKADISYFMSGITDAIKLIQELYENSRLDLEFKPGIKVRFNDLSDYSLECRLSSDIDLDEFEYTLLDRYYYCGVKQIFDLLNRDFYFKLKP